MIARVLVLSLAALALSGCLAAAVVKTVVVVPIKVVGASIDAVTTSQAEADEKRGREARKAEERAERERRKAEKAAGPTE